MSVAKYQVFLKTVECGSFTAAAREMNFTQSGVSHAIGSLEEELGVPLLIRSHGGVTPTADGRALLPYFEKMCAMQHQLEQQAADLRGLETGLVKVATFTSVSEKWLPNILKTFQNHYPHIEFELLPSNFNSEIGGWVLNGQADCGFISLPAPVEKYLDCWLLQRDQWKVIVPCDHPLAGANPFPPAALEQYPLHPGWTRATTMRSRRCSTRWASRRRSSTPSSRIRPSWPWCPAGWASASWRS